MGGASARDSQVTPGKRQWGRAQRRYHEILREIRSHLSRNGMCGVVRLLRRAAPEYLEREAIEKTRDDAREIEKLATKLSELLARTTLAPELRIRLGPNRHRLLADLEEIRRICGEAEKNQPGTDQLLLWCARIAYTLVYRFSEKMPTSGSPRSPYRVTASLLYEALTGEPGHDLRRACDAYLKATR